jgi:hypothetical protein
LQAGGTHVWSLDQRNIGVYPPAAAEDVRLWFMVEPDGVRGGLTYNTDIFDAPRVAEWMTQYGRLLADAMAHPDAPMSTLESMRAASGDESPQAATPAAQPTSNATPVTHADDADAAPQTETEQRLATIWAELLGTSDIRARDNFFDLGGHSLLVMQALSRMEQAVGKRIGPRHYVFDSLRQIALEYDNASAATTKTKKGFLRRLFGNSAEPNSNA